MYKIALINMPFSDLHMPSLGLTQIKSVLSRKYKKRLSVEIIYLNHDFAKYIGFDLYQYITRSVESYICGLGDWFFRQSAFPEIADNTESYFVRFYPHRNKQTQMIKHAILEKRQKLDGFLKKLIAQYNLDQTELVGFTSMFFQKMASFAMARKLKEQNRDIITVMGGSNCETPMGQEIVKQVKQIDFIFSGRALKSFSEFVQYCLAHEIEECNKINGVFSKKNCTLSLQQIGLDKPQFVGLFGDELDINVEIELDYDSFLDSLESHFPNKNVRPHLLCETSWGCWWGERSQCTFCGLNGSTMKYRAMKPEKAIKQFESLFRYSSRCPGLFCVDNNMPKSYLKEVFPFLNTPKNVMILYETKADLSGDNLKVLSKAGVNVIQPGIESLATSSLRLMKKGTTVFQNLLLLKNCLIHDVFPVWSLLVGFPGEDEDVYEKYIHDIPLLTHLPPPSGIVPVRFDRYSPYFNQPEKYGLKLRPFDFYRMVYPFSDEGLLNTAYYFIDHNFNAKYILTLRKWFPKVKKKIDLWSTRWYGKDQLPSSRLFFKKEGESSLIYDSRSGKIVEHQISDIGKDILEYLMKPRSTANLAMGLNHIPDSALEKETSLLQSLGLVFQEGEHLVSLVLPSEPSPMSFNIDRPLCRTKRG